MREMVLNHASLRVTNRDTAIESLKDLAAGMAALIAKGTVAQTLRASRPVYEIECLPDWTLFSAFNELKQSGGRDEFLFLARLSTRVPLLSGTSESFVDRFRMCEEKTLPTTDGEPLVYCAVTDGVAVGFPSDSAWDQDSVVVVFDELLSDGSFEEVSETIDNLTRSSHARVINDRYLDRLRGDLYKFADGAALWGKRQQAFPSLAFGPDVEAHLVALNPGRLASVIKKLSRLESSVARWQIVGGPAPPWQCTVSDESSSVWSNPRLREYRRFRSIYGSRELFMWHAKFSDGRRIHFRFDRSSCQIEIGYIGQHLPL